MRAFRRGERYGTILVDLEKRKPIDLLPDREAETLDGWLKAHPEVEIISRDRRRKLPEDGRARHTRCKLPTAFICSGNLLDGFERFLARQHQEMAGVFQKVFLPSVNRHNQPPPQTASLPSAAKRLEIEQKAARLAAHEKRFQTVKELHSAGTPILQIARRLKMSRNTVKKFLAAEIAPPRQPHRQRYSPIPRFLPFLQKRWIDDGERSRSRFVERDKTTRLSGSGRHIASFSAKMAGGGRY